MRFPPMGRDPLGGGWVLDQNGIKQYNLNFSGKVDSDYLLYSFNGNLVKSGRIVPGSNNINLSNLPSGYYIFKLQNSTQIQRLFLEP